MEKRKPTYNLNSIKDFFSSSSNQQDMHITRTALKSARNMGLSLDEVIEVIQSIKKTYFVKSMTSNCDYKIWQDVYNVPYEGMLLYIKFTSGRITEFKLLSFKEV